MEILDRVESEGRFAEPLLHECLESGRLEGPDRGFLTMLVYGTLRMRGRLDWIIGAFYHGKTAGMETGLLNILRIGIYQIFFLDRVPDFAAVNEAVEMARRMFPGRDRLVNAVLRQAARNRENVQYPGKDKDPALFVTVYHSHPLWLVEKFISLFGVDDAVALCRANNEIPPPALRVNALKANREDVLEALSRSGLEAKATAHSPAGIIITGGNMDIRSLTQFGDGVLHFQDEASQLISVLAGPRPGSSVLDLCAGAGGKSTHMAEIMGNTGRILAVDLSARKLEELGELARRHGIGIIESRRGDAAGDLGRDIHGAFDLVLIDAPCSGTGTLRRNPEIKWRLSPREIRRLAETQKKIVAAAPAYLKKGGAILYCTCSILPEENEQVVKDFLAVFPDFSVAPLSGPGAPPGSDGFFRTRPDTHGMDGFFGACLRRG